MGISPRVHFFDEQNTLHKIPYSKFDRLLNGDKSVSFIKFKAQKIRCATSYVEMQSVKAKQLYKKDFTWKANQQQIRAIVNQIFTK